MALRALPDSQRGRLGSGSAKPDSQIETIAPSVPAKAVPDPLEVNPNVQPDPKQAALRYIFEQNEKLRRRREKQQNR